MATHLERMVTGEEGERRVTLPATLDSEFGWGTLRLTVSVAPVEESRRALLSTELVIGDVSGADAVRFNGHPLGETSGMVISATGLPRRYLIPSRLIRFGGDNELEIRVEGLGGSSQIEIGAPITLAALGLHELWARCGDIRDALQRAAQTLWQAEQMGAGDARMAQRLWREHRTLLAELTAAETALGRGDLRGAHQRLARLANPLREIESSAGLLQLAVDSERAGRTQTLVDHVTTLLTDDQRARGVRVHARPEGFGRWGLALWDGTPFLEYVSPVEIRGHGEMAWRIIVDQLMATEVLDVNWMSKTTLVTGNRRGDPCDHTLTVSLPFPGVLIEQRAGRTITFELSAPQDEVGISAVGWGMRGGLVIQPLAGSRMLLVARRASEETLWLIHTGVPFEEVALTPRGADATRLTLTFDRGTPRRLTLVPVHGIEQRDTRWVAMRTVPTEVADVCAALLPLTAQVPVRVDEVYHIDDEAGVATLFDVFESRSLDPTAAHPEGRPIWPPPVASVARAMGQGVTFLVEGLERQPMLSVHGPVFAGFHSHGALLWTIPLPSLDGRFHLRPAGDDDLVAQLNEHLTDLGTPTMPNAVDRTYKSRAQGYHAWAMLTAANRRRLAENSAEMIPLTFDPAIWHRWEEPFSGLPVWSTYTLEGPAFDLYDQEWGNGLALYALSLWAMVEDGWGVVAAHRDALDRMWAWWRVTDDWAWLRCANAFHGHGTGAGDCSCAAHAGAIGRARLMARLGDVAARDEALYFAARSALSITARFGLTRWAREHGLIEDDAVAVGYHEGEGYLRDSVTSYPWTVTSMISGNGVQPEVHDLLMERVPNHLAAYEAEMLAANPTLFDGLHDYGRDTLCDGNSGHITLPHLHAQARLGTRGNRLRQWLAEAASNPEMWWLAPTVLAEMAGRGSGFWLLDWSAARLGRAWMDADGSAHVIFETQHTPLRWAAHCEAAPAEVRVEGTALDTWTWDAETQRLEVEADLVGTVKFTVVRP